MFWFDICMMFDIQSRFLDCNSWPNSSLLIFVFKQKIDETNFRTFFKGKIAKKQSRNIGLNPMHTFPAVSELLSYQLSKNWLTWLPLSTFKKIWIEMRLKSADTLEDRKKWRQKIFGKVPIDISKISVKLLSNYWFYNWILMESLSINIIDHRHYLFDVIFWDDDGPIKNWISL